MLIRNWFQLANNWFVRGEEYITAISDYTAIADIFKLC